MKSLIKILSIALAGSMSLSLFAGQTLAEVKVEIKKHQIDVCKSNKGYKLVIVKNDTSKPVYNKYYDGKSDKLSKSDYVLGKRGNKKIGAGESIGVCVKYSKSKTSESQHGTVGSFFKACKDCYQNLENMKQYTYKDGYGSLITISVSSVKEEDFYGLNRLETID